MAFFSKKIFIGATLTLVASAITIPLALYFTHKIGDDSVEENNNISTNTFSNFKTSDGKFWNWISSDGKILQKPNDWDWEKYSLPEKLIIPNSVETIARSTFQKGELPKGFTLETTNISTIESFAFADLIIQRGFKLPKSLSNIKSDSFTRSTLPVEFTLENTKVTTIEIGTFNATNLPEGFVIPTTVTKIDDKAFQNSIIPNNAHWFDSSNKQISDVDKIVGGSYILIPSFNFFRASDGKFWNWVSDDGKTLFLPNEWDWNKDIIPEGIQIPITVQNIQNGTFKNGKLPSDFNLQNTFVTSIGDEAFFNVAIPEGFKLPNSITSIGLSAFNRAIIPNSFTLENTQTNTIEDSAFYMTSLPNNFQLPRTVVSIGVDAFFEATLPKNFHIPASTSFIGTNAFFDVNLPENCKWFDKNGIVLKDQNNPIADSKVLSIV